ncbi:MAG: hypothetical protein ABIP64_05130 [Burkholderiales bacterium]
MDTLRVFGLAAQALRGDHQSALAPARGGHANAARGQTRLTITSTHAKQAIIQAVLTAIAGFLHILKVTAEQWPDAQRLHAILARAFAKFMLATADPPSLLTAQQSRI